MANTNKNIIEIAAKMTDEEKEAHIQGVEFTRDYAMHVTDEDKELYDFLIWEREIKNWAVSEYNEDTEEQLDYYFNERMRNPGDTAYMYSHRDKTYTKLEIIHVISRSNNIEDYDSLDKDVLLDGEDEYKADTSAEFITDNDCYLVWFTYKEEIYE